MLAKASATDFDTEWVDAAAGGSTVSDATITLPDGRGVFEFEGVIAAPGVTALQRAHVWLAAGTDADENTADMLDLISIAAACEADQLRVFLTFREPQSGPILLHYQVT